MFLFSFTFFHSLAYKPYYSENNTCRRLQNLSGKQFPLMEEAKSLIEADVGITCFVSSFPGFRGVLKQRYSDFIVNEVDLDGNVVHLTSLDPPPESEEENGDKKDEGNDRTESIEAFRSIAGDANAELLKRLLEKIALGMETDIEPIILSPDSDKSHRAEVHNFFKKNFKFLVTDTVEESEDSGKRVRVRFGSSGRNGGGQRGKKRKERNDSGVNGDRPYDSRGMDNWPESRGKFLRFHLYKENKDTQEALGIIAKMLGIQQRAFGFAGTKDKRSISTQRVTVFKQHAKKLAALNCKLFGIKVGDFCYQSDGLVLGQLLGNRFTIILRGVVADSEKAIREAADSLGENGFINYYGLQRFGSGSVPTHLIGAALLRGEWKHAVELILDPREGERTIASDARRQYKETGDINMALRQFPRYLVAERAVLQCLKKCPGNYLQALKAIPRTLRMMYVHSYQSYIWNHAASMRVQKHGVAKVILGDLVYSKEGSSRTLVNADKFEHEADVTDLYDDSIPSDIPETTLPEEKVVKVISSEDLVKGDYSFEDVVLPLPGSRVRYPENDIANVYDDMARKDGINLTESLHCAKEFSITNLTGGYRHIFQRPIDFKWELIKYKIGDIQLTETDLHIIQKSSSNLILDISADEKYNNHESSTGSEGNYLVMDDTCGGKVSPDETSFSSETDSSKLALKLELTLPASCYATMAIRELLKTSTSVAYHKTMNE